MIPAPATISSRTTAAPRLIAAIIGVLGFTVLTALAARVALPLPGTPVPVTLQSLFVTLAGLTLGARLGTLSMLFYLLLGTAGYGVFSFGQYGFETVLGATGGYLIGFVLCQPLLGTLTQHSAVAWPPTLAAILLAHAIILTCGVAWLSAWGQISPMQALALGFWPFLPGTVLKSAAALAAAPLAIERVRRRWF